MARAGAVEGDHGAEGGGSRPAGELPDRILGVDGGFVIVPGLVCALGYEMLVAVATSLLVIGINRVVALVARARHRTFDLVVLVPFNTFPVVGAVMPAIRGETSWTDAPNG